jgi:hypothetical protein
MAAALRFGDMIADLQQDVLEPDICSARQISRATSPKDPDLFSSIDNDEQSKAARS